MKLPIAIAFAFVLPLQHLHREALAPLNYERTTQETAFFSTPLEGFVSTSAANRIWGGPTESLRTIVEADFFPGITLLALALLALLASRSIDSSRRAVLFSGVLALMAALVAPIHATTRRKYKNVSRTRRLARDVSQCPGVGGRDKPGHDG